jgi:hypothetical protein
LRDLSQYDALNEALVNEGVNKIDNVVSVSQKISTIPTVKPGKLAMKDAKLKAEDYVSVLAKKSRQAVTTDNSQTIHSLLC